MQPRENLTVGVLNRLMHLVSGTNDVTFEFDNYATTASIDMGSGHVVLPKLDIDADEDIVVGFSMHESFHARWTSREYGKLVGELIQRAGEANLCIDENILKDAVNVLEDVRIEWLGIQNFSGINTVLSKKYNSIWDNNNVWGDTKESHKHIEKRTRFNVFSRINYWWKMSQWVYDAHKIKLNEVDQKLVDDVRNAESTEEVVDILFDFCMEHYQKDMFDDDDDETISLFTNEQFWKDVEKEIGEKDNQEYSNEELNKRLRTKKAERKIYQWTYEEISDWIVQLRKYAADIIIMGETQWPLLKNTHKTSLKDGFLGMIRIGSEPAPKGKNPILKMSQNIHRSLERKKKAAQDHMTRVWDSGDLDPTRLHLASVSDDVFLSSQTEFNGSTYGMIFMLDNSGSMRSGTGTETLKKLAVMTSFAKMSGIKFEVRTWGQTGGGDGVIADDTTFATPKLYARFFNNYLAKNHIGLFNCGTNGAYLCSQLLVALDTWEQRKKVSLKDTSVYIMTDGDMSFSELDRQLQKTEDKDFMSFNTYMVQGKDRTWRNIHLNSFGAEHTSIIPDSKLNAINSIGAIVNTFFPQVNVKGIIEEEYFSPHYTLDKLSFEEMMERDVYIDDYKFDFIRNTSTAADSFQADIKLNDQYPVQRVLFSSKNTSRHFIKQVMGDKITDIPELKPKEIQKRFMYSYTNTLTDFIIGRIESADSIKRA